MNQSFSKFATVLGWIAVLALTNLARAEHFYMSQSALGSGTGADASNSKAIAFFNTAANWSSPTKATGKIGPGDTVHLVGTISTSLVVQASGTATGVITILFEPGAMLSKPYWGLGNSAAIASTNRNYVLIDGNNVGIIESNANGDSFANQQQSRGMDISGSNNWEIRNLTIRNIYVHVYNNSSATDCRGISAFDCNSLYIHDNTVTDSYYGVITGAASPKLTSSIDISHNNFSNCSTGIVVGLGAVGGSIDNVKIYNNDITMGLNWFDTADANHIDGIHNFGNYGVSDQITNMTINNNFIHGYPSSHSTGHIYLEYDIISPLIYNNVLVSQTNAPNNGYIAIKSQSLASAPKIFNNTIVGIGTGSSGGIGINLAANALASPTIKNNILSTLFVGIYEPNGVANITSDNNCFYTIGTVGWRISISDTLAQWRTATGDDLNSITSNPALVAGSYRIPTNSPAAGIGASLTSVFTTDIAGSVRAIWDMGAYIAGTGVILPPTAAAIAIQTP